MNGTALVLRIFLCIILSSVSILMLATLCSLSGLYVTCSLSGGKTLMRW